MPYVTVNGADLYYEEHGRGIPILCVHGTGSAGYVWDEAARKLGDLGRAIAYDRRGFTRSPRADAPPVTEVREHTEDAWALLRALDAEPAVVIGRSYGGGVALDLALSHPESVRGLVLLEAVVSGLSAEMDAWGKSLLTTLERTAAERGVTSVGEAMLREALGEWETLPASLRDLFSGNSAAILAETRGGDLAVDPERLATITAPVLVISAAASPPAFRAVAATLASALPDARSALVEGGHLIDPAGPEVLAFVASLAAADDQELRG